MVNKKVAIDNSQRDIKLIKCSQNKHSKYNDGKPCEWCEKELLPKH